MALTVKELKEALENLDDNMDVFISQVNNPDTMYAHALSYCKQKIRYKGEGIPKHEETIEYAFVIQDHSPD